MGGSTLLHSPSNNLQRFIAAISYPLAFMLFATSAWLATTGFQLGTTPTNIYTYKLLAAVIASAAIQVLSLTSHRKPLGAADTFYTIAVVLILGAACQPELPIWTVPTTFKAAFSLSQIGATAALLTFCALQSASLVSREKCLMRSELILVTSAPFLFSWLLLLAAPNATNHLTTKLIVLGAFNIFIATLLTRVTTHVFKATASLNLLLLGSALLAALTPSIANLPHYIVTTIFTSSSAITSFNSAFLPQYALIPSVLLIISVAAAQAGLWAQTYLITGFLMDALHGRQPTYQLGKTHFTQGLIKGAVYGGIFMSVIVVVKLVSTISSTAISHYPYLAGAILGTLFFPLLKTIIESFDGSSPFMSRLGRAHLDPINYLRGLILGAGIAVILTNDMPTQSPWLRSFWGFLIGSAAFAGVNILRDLRHIFKEHRGNLQSLRVYTIEALFGGTVGMAIGWYAEASQLQVIAEKFLRYAAYSVVPAAEHTIYPLFSKWGAIDLGNAASGSRLLYNESLSGIISWSLAAPLFSINLVFLTALLRKDSRPLRDFVTTEGLQKVMNETLRVERWGLWMAPIIYSFLRMSPLPTWYNQDGAIRTLLASFMSLTYDYPTFSAWSLAVFTNMLSYDWLRILIWFDHMGLRVATLVNMSFIGGDMLDEKAAHAMGHSGATRCIPEGLRRFGTWMPLLIPFYIPRGADWDTAWNTAETIAKTQPSSYSASSIVCALFVIPGIAIGIKKFFTKQSSPGLLTGWTRKSIALRNANYTIELDTRGRGWSQARRTTANREEIDLSRRPDSPYSPLGKTFYIVEPTSETGKPSTIWSTCASPAPHPQGHYNSSLKGHKSYVYTCEKDSLSVETTVTLDDVDTIERWQLRLSNSAETSKRLEVISYRDLVLQANHLTERHPNFNDLHIATWFVPQAQAIFAQNRLLVDGNRKPTSEVYFHALANLPQGAVLLGYEDSRSAIIGTGSERSPIGINDHYRLPDDEGMLYPFDPAASLRIAVTIPPDATITITLAEGYASDIGEGIELLAKHLATPRLSADEIAASYSKLRSMKSTAYTRSAERPKPWAYSEDGKEITITGETPRPWSHPVANPKGYGFLANNEGSIFSFNGNAQQHSLTPFSLGLTSGVTPGQAWYFWDMDAKSSLLNLPLRLNDTVDNNEGNQQTPSLETIYGRGYVLMRSQSGRLRVEITAFVLPDRPAEGRIIKLRNDGTKRLRLRMVSITQMVLAELPGDSRGNLVVDWDDDLQMFLTENPMQHFIRGPVFIAPGFPLESKDCVYSRIIGTDASASNPYFVEHGCIDPHAPDDGFRAAALSTIIELPPGSETTLSLVMGQATNPREARQWVYELRSPSTMKRHFRNAKTWWEDFLNVLRVETNDPSFDRLVNDWIPYQLVASRLWGRTGPYQRSGAFGFRDQLQDVIPLATLHPEYCRAQILLHAEQQFLEGDTLQWWHTTWEGKTGIGARNRASDISLWLPYVTLQYLNATGDKSILNEHVSFLEGKQIPKHHEGICFVPRPSSETATVYEHCRRSLELGIRNLGANGIPLMGSGDWNDGLDSIGKHGIGESVWLGFFLHSILIDFAPIAELKEGIAERDRLLQVAAKLKDDLGHMWRGQQFLRAINDQSKELLYKDALTSAWPLISRAVDIQRGTTALETGLSALERDKIVLLLFPSFTEHSDPYPGRISLYPPGVRENGGQYSHGSSWLVDACLYLAEMIDEAGGEEAQSAHWRKRAGDVWHKISPLAHTSDSEWLRYGLEPHQQPADIYFGHGYEGRGGWSWYTGSAGRMLVAAWQLLGIDVRDGELSIKPWAGSNNWPKLRKVTYRGQELKVE